MIRSWIISIIFSVSLIFASSSAQVAQIYDDLSQDSNVQNQCQQGCRVCLNAIVSSTNQYYKQLSQDTGLNTFITAYNANPRFSNNSNSLDGYTIFSNGWDADPLGYGITNGWNLNGVPSNGPVIDGSAVTIGDTYSWLNGQFYHVHLDQVNTASKQAVLWARTRENSNPVYAKAAIRTPKCTFWGMASTVYPPNPGAHSLYQTLQAYGCSNWAQTLMNTLCNGTQALAMFTSGTLFALPDSVFNTSSFNSSTWGHNNGSNVQDSICNVLKYYSVPQAIPYQNSSVSGSAATNYYVNGAAQTIEYQYNTSYNVNSTGAAEASQIYNGYAKSIYGDIPIWLNANNGSTLVILDKALDPRNKTSPPKSNTTNTSGNATNPNAAHDVTSGYSTMIFCAVSMIFAALAL